MTDSTQSQLRTTALRFVEGYNRWDIDAILAPRSPDCKQRVYPARLNRPLLGNAEYRHFFTELIEPYFKKFHVEVLDVVEDHKNDKVVFYAASRAETAIGEYRNEYMILLHLTEDHKEIKFINEFVDSGYSDEFFPRLRAHLAKEE